MHNELLIRDIGIWMRDYDYRIMDKGLLMQVADNFCMYKGLCIKVYGYRNVDERL